MMIGLKRTEFRTKEVGMFVAKDSEARVGEALGLPRMDLKKIRAGLTRGVDWELQNGSIRYSEVGIERIMAKMGLKGGRVLQDVKEAFEPVEPVEEAPAVSSGAEQGSTDRTDKTDGEKKPAAVESFVLRRCCPNPTWVECVRRLENGKLRMVIVRVPMNTNLRPGMVLKNCRRHPGALGEKGRWMWAGGPR